MIFSPSLPVDADLRKILETVSRSESGQGSPDLLPLLYHELRRLAATYMAQQSPGQTLQPTALVHEAWLRLSKTNSELWKDRSHFFRAAAQTMRCILVDRARSKASYKHGENAQPLDISELDLAQPTTDERVLMVDEMLDLLEAENPEGSRVITLKFFGGLTNKDIATMDGVTERTIERRWAYAKTRLYELIRQEITGKNPQQFPDESNS